MTATSTTASATAPAPANPANKIKFADFSLNQRLKQALQTKGIESPTPIQEKVLNLLLQKDVPTDLIGKAQTGTGKTFAYLLPLLHRMQERHQLFDADFRKKQTPRALILVPTRELALQVAQEAKFLLDPANNTPDHDKNSLARGGEQFIVTLYGGAPVGGQWRDLERQKAFIVIGTPGRVMDMIERGAFKLDDVETLILDEGDEMLDRGFLDDIEWILEQLSSQAKDQQLETWLFSATMPPRIRDLTHRFLKQPHIVEVPKPSVTNESITQKLLWVKERDFARACFWVLGALNPNSQALIFCKTKIETSQFAQELRDLGIKALDLHGDLSQSQREATLGQFRSKKCSIIVATDVAARGIDVDGISHVINLGLPQDLDSYVHRIGRTGRAGKTGEAITLVDPRDRGRVVQLERMTRAKLEKHQLPSMDVVMDQHIKRVTDELKQTLFAEKPSEQAQGEVSEQSALLTKAFEGFVEKMSELNHQDLLQYFFDLYLKKPLMSIQRMPNPSMEDRSSAGSSNSSYGGGMRGGSSLPMIKIAMDKGLQDGVHGRMIVQDLGRILRTRPEAFGNIRVQEQETHFDVAQVVGEKILRLKNFKIRRQDVNFQRL